MRGKIGIALACACLACVSAGAQTADAEQIEAMRKSHKVLYFGDEEKKAEADSVRRMIDRFYVTQYHHFQDPQAPYFLMMSRDATLAMGIGGLVRMRGWYDFDGAMPVNGFIPYMIPIPEDPANQRRLAATPSGTALFFRIIGQDKTLGNFQAFILAGFDGGTDSQFKLKQSYVIINDWTIGYAPSAFWDQAANPPLIEAQGHTGQANRTAVQLRWTHQLRHGWSVAASAEFPQSYAGADGVSTKAINDWLPDIVAYGQYSWANGAGHARLSALARCLPYRNLVEGKNRNVAGWGVQLSAVSPVGYNWTLYGEAIAGKGISSYVNDLRISRLDLIADAAHTGKMYAPSCYGFTLGVKYNFLPNLFASVSASESLYKPKRADGTQEYKYGLYGMANIFWNLTARIQAGAEYVIGKRMNYDGAHGDAQRVNLLFQYSF
ncbi:MAG: hypothetical protein NC102_08865 [Clostridium sp.]|nr:hypothetical protein [Clostridium sp.]